MTLALKPHATSRDPVVAGAEILCILTHKHPYEFLGGPTAVGSGRRPASITLPLASMRLVSLVSLSLSLGACRPSASEARRMLESDDPAKRQAGASALQKMYATDPTSVGDHGEAYWVERVARVRGKSASEAMRIFGGAQVSGGEAGGGGVTETWRLDDYWVTTVGRSTRGDDTIFDTTPPRRLVVHVDLMPPARFTGTWKTYFVNGAVYESVEVEGGVRGRDRFFHDDGKLRYEQVFVDGKIDGTVLSRDARGVPEWEQTYAKGKQVGLDKMFYPSGKLRQEAHYADGKLDGLMRNFSESGAVTYCAAYDAGVQVDGGCN